MKALQPALAEIDAEFGTTVVVPRMLDARQITALANIERSTLRSMVQAGTFPAPRLVGNKQLWDAREYNAWIERLPRLTNGEDVPRGRPPK